MFESAELGHRIDKITYEAEVPALRAALLDAQISLVNTAQFQVIILVGGMDCAGRSETVNLISEWMDPRYIQTHGMGTPSDEESERPDMWRFWRELPAKGRIGVFLGSWYTLPIIDRVLGNSCDTALAQSLERAKHFEEMLHEEGAVIIKLWLHLSKAQQEHRLKTLERNPQTQWRVTKRDWKHFKAYHQFKAVHETVIRQTSTANMPWVIIEGEDHHYRNLTVGKIILETLQNRLKLMRKKLPDMGTVTPMPALDHLHILKALDLTKHLEKKKFVAELAHYQGKLNALTRHPKFKEMSVIIVLEGSDAAGKGGSIRRITGALDARYYEVHPIAAPSEEERAQPYLWRFWRRLPRRGRVSIFDRSWYGRVLVERVEGFCKPQDWMRAYNEINAFETQLVQHQVMIVKFWLAISKDEQLNRFEDRQKTAYKRFKITEEDWRNREKWADYEQAVCDMVERTSSGMAPWTLVEANDKNYARVKILKTLCACLENTLENLSVVHEKSVASKTDINDLTE